MGNCLPFMQAQIPEDLTRLNRLTMRRSSDEANGSRRSSQRHSQTSTNTSQQPSGSRSDRSRRSRNLYSSSYVNELYMSSIVPTNEEGRFDKAVDQKRQARVRGLLEQIPIDLYVTGGKGSTECPICIVEFEENDRIRFLPCMHNYHVECIDDWLLRSFTCPSCMEPVDSAILSTFTTTSTDLSSLVCSPATNIKSGSSKSD